MDSATKDGWPRRIEIDTDGMFGSQNILAADRPLRSRGADLQGIFIARSEGDSLCAGNR